MAYSAITQPFDYMSAYSAVPLKIYSTSYNTSEQFKYIVNMCWDVVSITGNTSYSLFNNLFTKLTSTTPHNFDMGDKVYVDDTSNGNEFTGYYNIRKIISTTQFVIDLEPSSPFGTNPFNVYKVIKYKLSPDLQGYGKLDLSNTLKDFVSQNLTGQTSSYGLSYDGPDTRFDYNIICGSEEKFVLLFEDNIFISGLTGFYNSSITGLTESPFQIGDAILIQQELYGWTYIDNVFDGGNVGFTGATTVPFSIGQQVTVTGQVTYPSYNGLTTMLDTGSTTNILVTEKSWVASSPTEGGVIYGTPRPEYNTTTIITNIFIDPTYGLVILTNLPWGGSSPTIPGTIRYASDILTTQSNLLTISGLSVFNSYQNRIDYTMSGFDPYVIQNRATNLNNTSTILNSNNDYRIEPSTIGFLLTHIDNNTSLTDGMGYVFYDSSNTLLGEIVIPKPSNSLDYYSPIGIEQISHTTSKVQITGAFSGYSGSIDNYNMFVVDYTGVTYSASSNMITFKINPECSKYELYNLMWKDKNGSFISYPFKFVSRDNIEVERKNYYQSEGNWDNNTFGYDQYGRGDKTFHSKSRKNLVINSGWLYEFERDLIEDLIQSPSVYLQTPSNQLIGCTLDEKKLEIYKQINEDLFSYSFNVILSSNEFRF